MDLMDLKKFSTYLNAKVRPGTARLYMKAVREWFSWLRDNKLEANAKNAQVFVDFLSRDSLSPSTINSRAHGIMRMLRYFGKPVDLDLPSIKPLEPEYLKPGEVDNLMSACRTLLEKALIVVLYDTAVRISELLNLKVEDIDRKGMLIKVTRKGGAEDLVNISQKGLKALDDWMDSRGIKSGRVFLFLRYTSALKLVREVGLRAGLGGHIHPHILRHSRAIQMLMAGTPIYVVQRHLGHKSITTTINIYGKFMAADIKKNIPSI